MIVFNVPVAFGMPGFAELAIIGTILTIPFIILAVGAYVLLRVGTAWQLRSHKPCPTCATPMSAQVSACPHCGSPAEVRI